MYKKWNDWKDVIKEKVPNEKILGIVIQYDIFPDFDSLFVHCDGGKVFKSLLNVGLSDLQFVEIKNDKEIGK